MESIDWFVMEDCENSYHARLALARLGLLPHVTRARRLSVPLVLYQCQTLSIHASLFSSLHLLLLLPLTGESAVNW